MASARTTKGKRSLRGVLIVVAFVGAIILASGVQMGRTSSTEYCMSCHEMKPYLEELKVSSHAKDKDGKEIGCVQCHIPAGVGPKYLTVKTVVGMNDLLVHYFGDPDNLNRRALQSTARRFVDDGNCRACHEDLYKDAKSKKDISPIGKLCHEAYLNKNGNTSRGCAGCHFNMAHLPDFDRRFFFNQKFANKLKPEAERRRKGGQS